jgi:hypothetical protein
MVFIMNEKGLFSPGSEQSHSQLNYVPPTAEPARKAPVTHDVTNKPAEGITVGATRSAQEAETTSTTEVEQFIQNQAGKSHSMTSVERYLHNKPTNAKSVTGVELYSIRNMINIKRQTSVELYIQRPG